MRSFKHCEYYDRVKPAQKASLLILAGYDRVKPAQKASLLILAGYDRVKPAQKASLLILAGYDIIFLMLIASIGVNILGILVFLFLFWKRQKEDFSSEIIFKLAFHILIGIGIGFLISFYLSKAFWLWLSFAGGVAGMLAAIYRLKTRFHEIFEAFIIGVLPWLSFIFLLDSVIHSSLSSFLGFLGILIVIFVSYWLDAHYKDFNWYKSGKIGFSGLATLGLVFVIRFGLALTGIRVLSFVDKFEFILSGSGILVCFLLLVGLARKIT